jgi:hypothetical protein
MTRHETLTPANMPQSPPIMREADEDTDDAATSFESRKHQQDDDTFVLCPCAAECAYDFACGFVTFYSIYITFCFFWVQGTANSLEYPFLREMQTEYIYGIVMSLFTAVVLNLLAYFWGYGKTLCTANPTRWALIRFVVIGLHVAAPFVVSSIILHAEYDQACNGYALTLASSRGGGLESGSRSLGTYYMTSEQNRTLRLGFNVSQGDGIDDNVGVNLNTSYELVCDGSGNGHLRMDCGEVPRCVTGKLHLRHNSLEGEIRYLGGKPKAVKLSNVWWGNPMAISIDGQYALETAGLPTTDEVKICANDLHVAIIGGSFVSLLQGHVRGCRRCFDGCRYECLYVGRRLVGSGDVGVRAQTSDYFSTPEMARRRLSSECSAPVCFEKCATDCSGVAADSFE